MIFMGNKAIFLDRDDTLIEDPGYINDPEQVKVLDGVPEALVELKNMGYKLVVVSNQSGVARGIVTEEVLGDIHNRLRQLLAEKGAFLDNIYYCPFHPDGAIPKYRQDSELRKPKPGMLLAAAREMHIDLGQSWAIGNSGRDVEAGVKAGCRTILIDHPAVVKEIRPGQVKPDFTAVNMREAVNIVKKYHRMRPAAQPEAVSAAVPAAQVPAATEVAAVPEEVPAVVTMEAAPVAEVKQVEVIEKPASFQAETINEDTVQAENNEVEERPKEQAVSEKAGVKVLEKGSERLLGEILVQLKVMQRDRMFNEFTITRVAAGIAQAIVFLCLLIGIWLLTGPARTDNLIVVTLLFGVVLQLMALTFYIMNGRR
jgi:D-glycero-D-manno-heptose 1,7-bisphosphate phosphatase